MAEDAFTGFLRIETENFQFYLESEIVDDALLRTLQFQTEDAFLFIENERTDETLTGSIRIEAEEVQFAKSWDFKIPDPGPNDDARLTFVEDYSLVDIL